MKKSILILTLILISLSSTFAADVCQIGIGSEIVAYGVGGTERLTVTSIGADKDGNPCAVTSLGCIAGDEITAATGNLVQAPGTLIEEAEGGATSNPDASTPNDMQGNANNLAAATVTTQQRIDELNALVQQGVASEEEKAELELLKKDILEDLGALEGKLPPPTLIEPPFPSRPTTEPTFEVESVPRKVSEAGEVTSERVSKRETVITVISGNQPQDLTQIVQSEMPDALNNPNRYSITITNEESGEKVRAVFIAGGTTQDPDSPGTFYPEGTEFTTVTYPNGITLSYPNNNPIQLGARSTVSIRNIPLGERIASGIGLLALDILTTPNGPATSLSNKLFTAFYNESEYLEWVLDRDTKFERALYGGPQQIADEYCAIPESDSGDMTGVAQNDRLRSSAYVAAEKISYRDPFGNLQNLYSISFDVNPGSCSKVIFNVYLGDPSEGGAKKIFDDDQTGRVRWDILPATTKSAYSKVCIRFTEQVPDTCFRQRGAGSDTICNEIADSEQEAEDWQARNQAAGGGVSGGGEQTGGQISGTQTDSGAWDLD